MTQDNDLYAIKNDGRGWRIVSEVEFNKFMERVDPDVIASDDGFGLYGGCYANELVGGCSLKFPLTQLKTVIDFPLREVFAKEIAARQERLAA